jgi:membrane protease YdiL (CAAX protease family)
MNAVLTLLMILPFILAVLLANLAQRNKNLSVLLYVYLLLLNGLLMFIGVSSLLLSVARVQGNLADLGPALGNVDWLGAGAILLIGSIIALLLLLPPVRRVAARLLPMDASSVVHATALSMTATTIAGNLYQMKITAFLLTPEGLKQAQQGVAATYVDILIFPLLTLAVTALLSVGWLTRRPWPEVVERLGLKMPTLPQLGLAVGVTVLLLGLSIGADRLWAALDPEGLKQVGGISSALLNNFTGLSGAFAIGITAAIGEESFFRGAYLPRMGLLLSALLFASFHVQYFVSIATLLIFVIGLVLGVLRQRTTLAVCILVHFLYNFTSVLLGSS